ncbi:MAG: M16 family metallopeptidase [Candidatus Rokuibacteriota bacterium]
MPFACALLGLLLTAGRAQAQAPPPVVAHVLPNGLTVLVRENPAVGVVAASLQVRAGSRFETESSAGITNFLHRAMVRGTARRTAVELAISAEDIGGSVDANGEVEAAEVRGQALAGHWEELLALVAEVALQPALRPDEVEKERRLLLGQIKARADAPFSLSFDAVLREIYGTNPYGRSHLGSRESIERLTRDDLLAHYRAIYHPDRMVLAVSGQVARARVIKAAERLFGRMARSGPDTLVAQPVAAPSGERRVIARPAQQAQILVGYLGPALSDPLFPAVRVLAAALGGGMAGRLFVELRDSRGLAYSTAVLTPFRTGPIFIVAYLGTAPASATAAEAGVLRELERVREAPIKGDELARAKAYVRGQLAMDRRTNARRAWYLAFFQTVGAGWDFPDRYARALEAVTAEDVARAAEQYLTRPSIVVLQPTR